MKKIKTNEIKQQHIFGLITGFSGAGKTHALGTLSEKDTVIIDIEGGLLTLKDKNFEVWKISSASELREAYLELKNGSDFKHVGIDSFTEIGEVLFASLRPNFTKAQNFGLYEEFTKQMIGLTKAFRDLTEYNVWITCLLKETDRGVIPDVVQKSLGTRIPQYFDIVGIIQKFEKDEKVMRAMLFDSVDYDFCKTRSNSLDQFEKVDLEAITNKIFKEKRK